MSDTFGLFPIEDPILTDSSHRYLTLLELLTTSIDDISTWQAALSRSIRDVPASASQFPSAFLGDAALSSHLSRFVASGREVTDALPSVLEDDIQAMILPLRRELQAIGPLRTRALTLQYRLEQVESMRGTKLGSVLPMQDADEVAVASAEFREALETFVGRLDEAKIEIMGRIWAQKAAVMGVIDDNVAWMRAVKPKGVAIDFGAVDAILDEAFKKVERSDEDQAV